MDTLAIITAFSTRSEVLIEVRYEIANIIGDWVEQLRSVKHVKIPVGHETPGTCQVEAHSDIC